MRPSIAALSSFEELRADKIGPGVFWCAGRI